MQPKLSIITVNLNNAEGLQKTIESVVSQTFTDYEYIIIDGGSTDGSKEIIERYADKITYWVSEPDKGIYNGMNKGLFKTIGKYVFFLNSGDYFLTNNVLEKVSANTLNYDFLFTGVLKSDEESGTKFRDIPKNVDKISLFKKMICHQSIFVKKNVFDKIGYFDTKYKIKADYEWLLRAITKNEFLLGYFSEVITYYPLGGVSDKYYNKYTPKENRIIWSIYYSPKSEKFLRRYIYRPSLNKIMQKLLSIDMFRAFVLKKIS